MARGRDQHEARKQAVLGLGRNLSRRSRSLCELCGNGGTLRVIEVEPVDEIPHEDAAILICEECQEHLQAKHLDDGKLRFLEGSAWSEVEPVKITSIVLLKRLAAQQVSWAQECLDGLWIEEPVQNKLDRIK